MTPDSVAIKIIRFGVFVGSFFTMKRNVLGLAAAVISLGMADFAYPATPEDELAALLFDHPNIRAAYKTVESSRQGIAHAKSAYYPQISISGDVAHEVIDSPSERQQGDGQLGKPSSRTPQSFSFTSTQNLFNGFATVSAVRTAKLNKELAQLTLEGTRQNTVLEGINAYVNVLRQKRLIELSRENEATILQQLNLEDERVRRGSGIAVDVLQAKSRLQSAKERRVTFEGALEDAISRFAQTFNHAPDIDAMIDPMPPIEMVPSDLDRSIDIALSGNPALANSSVTIEVARERKRTVRAEL